MLLLLFYYNSRVISFFLSNLMLTQIEIVTIKLVLNRVLEKKNKTKKECQFQNFKNLRKNDD